MKKYTVNIIFLVFFFIIILSSESLATDDSVSIWSKIFSGGKNFVQDAEPMLKSEEVRDVSNTIYDILFYIGMSISVIIGSILGIKIILASAEEKAKIKEQLIPYIIGCFVIFGSFGIWRIVVKLFDGF